jgi:hypothetical protein
VVARRKSAAKSTRRRRSAGRKATRSKSRRWSARVTRESDALDLERSVFKSSDPHKIALSLKRSAERSKRRRSAPYRSAMSMLVFYINRAGRNLPKRQARVLERAKGELRKVFDRE